VVAAACDNEQGVPTGLGPPHAFFRSVSSISTDGSPDHGAGVFIDLAGACGMFDGNGNVVISNDAHPSISVVTESGNGNALYNCLTQVANPTGRAIFFDSDHNPLGIRIPCEIQDDAGVVVFTLDVHEEISASGEGHLTCVFNGRR
jgi:hypothetical protein